MPDITYDVGRVSFIMKGAWNLATNYEKLDAVSYNGSLYIAKQDVPGGTAITNTTYWQLAAEKGDKGDTGGVDSVNGQQGDIWFPDSRQLISDGYTTDTVPFLMKGNDSDSDRFEFAKKLGNTVCVNDMFNPANALSWTQDGITVSFNSTTKKYTISGTATATIDKNIYGSGDNTVKGRKYAFISGFSGGSGSLGSGYELYVYGGNFGTYVGMNKINESTNGGGFVIYLKCQSGVTIPTQTFSIDIPDISLWFGSNDRIPSDLLSHPENWGRYYAGSLAYAAGYLDSADGTILTSIHRNVWNEQTEKGSIGTNGQDVAYYLELRTIGYTEVIPNTRYYLFNGSNWNIAIYYYDSGKNFISVSWLSNKASFTTPANAHFFRARFGDNYGTTYKNDITISLYYSGESGYDQYYPFSVLAEVDTGSEVLRSAGAVADEKTPDGTITRKVGVVDLGTLTWVYVSSRAFFQVSAAVPGVPVGGAGGKANAHCAKYAIVTNGEVASTDKSMAVGAYYASGCNIYVKDTSYGTDAAAFKTAMSGVILNYELATPTTEQGTAFDPLVVTVKNGVLSWTNTKGIPVGHESHYFENLRKRVEDRLPDPPSADGTYRLTCTISGGVKTYSWEA